MVWFELTFLLLFITEVRYTVLQLQCTILVTASARGRKNGFLRVKHLRVTITISYCFIHFSSQHTEYNSYYRFIPVVPIPKHTEIWNYCNIFWPICVQTSIPVPLFFFFSFPFLVLPSRISPFLFIPNCSLDNLGCFPLLLLQFFVVLKWNNNFFVFFCF